MDEKIKKFHPKMIKRNYKQIFYEQNNNYNKINNIQINKRYKLSYDDKESEYSIDTNSQSDINNNEEIEKTLEQIKNIKNNLVIKFSDETEKKLISLYYAEQNRKLNNYMFGN
jgi:hypothetical protein